MLLNRSALVFHLAATWASVLRLCCVAAQRRLTFVCPELGCTSPALFISSPALVLAPGRVLGTLLLPHYTHTTLRATDDLCSYWTYSLVVERSWVLLGSRGTETVHGYCPCPVHKEKTISVVSCPKDSPEMSLLLTSRLRPPASTWNGLPRVPFEPLSICHCGRTVMPRTCVPQQVGPDEALAQFGIVNRPAGK
ncbi:hypothetical protein C8Q78DRAFT_296497 [Trametes maxima]|nr:hypothetical protein C8Q78DRAFT_296497 [Trametes maxima]